MSLLTDLLYLTAPVTLPMAVCGLAVFVFDVGSGSPAEARAGRVLTWVTLFSLLLPPAAILSWDMGLFWRLVWLVLLSVPVYGAAAVSIGAAFSRLDASRR
ncbi:MAG: hypothetical protein Q3966_02895 [Neisseria sp.]|nr:hypothetical protein [Neisseria sp.]